MTVIMEGAITQRIFEWAERTPDKIAFAENEDACSYQTFAEMIAKYRAYFTRHGVFGEGYAIIGASRLLNAWAVSFALRSLGVTIMSVGQVEDVRNAGLPGLRWVILDPGPVPPELETLCAERELSILAPTLDEDPLYPEFDPRAFRPGGVILRTSATTGIYKKVLIDVSFEETVLSIRNANRRMRSDAVHMAFAFPPWTGTGYKEPAGAWLVGATVIYRSDGRLHESLNFPGVTHGVMTPPILRTVLGAPSNAFQRNDNLHLTLAAGSVPAALLDEAKVRITPHIFCRVNATEAARYCYTALRTSDDQRWHQPAPGALHIVDDDGRPLPLGQVGHVRLSTADGPKSYLHDEEATRAFFRDGFFYPGDLAIMREDGRILLQGRAGDVINIHGVKFSPLPIEDWLRETLGVNGACLLVLQNDAGEEELHVILETETQLPSEQVVNQLRQMISPLPTTRLYYAASLPRNHLGKLIRREAQQLVLATRATTLQDGRRI